MSGDREWHDEPLPLTGLPALRRWLVCKASHTGVAVTWTVSHPTPGTTHYEHTVWCGDCGRRLKAGERARCYTCGQPINYHQRPDTSDASALFAATGVTAAEAVANIEESKRTGALKALADPGISARPKVDDR